MIAHYQMDRMVIEMKMTRLKIKENKQPKTNCVKCGNTTRKDCQSFGIYLKKNIY